MVQYASTNREQKRRREEEKKEEAVKKLRGRNKASRRPTPTGKRIPTGPTGRNKLRQSRKDELNLKRSQTKYEDGQTDTVKKAVAGKTPSAKKVLEKVLKKTTAPRMTGAAPTNPKEQARLKAIAGKQKAMPKNRSISDRLNRKMSQTKYKDGQTDIVKEAVSPIKKARGITNPARSSMLPIPKKRSRMEQDQDMITGIGERAAAANKKPTTSRKITNPAVSSMLPIPKKRSRMEQDQDMITGIGERAAAANKKPTTNTSTTPYVPPIGGSPNYSELTRPRKITKPKPKPKPKASADNTVDYSEATRPRKIIESEPKTSATNKKTTTKKVEPKKKSFRQRRLERLKKRAANEDTSEGRKRRLKRRIGRVEDRIEKGKKKKPKNMMGGGMAMAEKPYKHGKEVKSYKVGKTVKSSKLPGAGIESKGTRPCQMR